MENERGERKDIISFYNEVYIKVMKEYIIATKIGPTENPNPSRTPIINSIGTLTPGFNRS